MQSEAKTVDEYIEELPDDRRDAIKKLRKSILENIPEGFKETMGYGMIGYVVPHSTYPGGYHANPKLPLPFINVGSQKNYISLHHMGIYSRPELLEWFTGEYIKITKLKPDMGKGCIRFKKPEKIPFELIGELVSRISVKEWISIYEKNRQTGWK
jgi:uncharacterized protein YdhG (YjbR/CyaY superfamily)